MIASTSVASDSGWTFKNGFYKPFVKVSNPSRKFVLFITEKGKVYKGSCRKRSAESCIVYPKKKFFLKEDVTYVVIELTGSFPRVVKVGKVDN